MNYWLGCIASVVIALECLAALCAIMYFAGRQLKCRQMPLWLLVLAFLAVWRCGATKPGGTIDNDYDYEHEDYAFESPATMLMSASLFESEDSNLSTNVVIFVTNQLLQVGFPFVANGWMMFEVGWQPGAVSNALWDCFENVVLATNGWHFVDMVRVDLTRTNDTVAIRADRFTLKDGVAWFCVFQEGSDTDGDGLSNNVERFIYDTDPTMPDSDGDGYADGSEVISNTDPNATTILCGGTLSSGAGILSASLSSTAVQSAGVTSWSVISNDFEWADFSTQVEAENDYYDYGLYFLSIVYTTDDLSDGFIVHGASYPSGIAVVDDFSLDYGWLGHTNSFTMSGSGPKFVANKVGKYKFQVCADDYLAVNLGSGQVASAQWPNTPGNVASVKMFEDDEFDISLSYVNEGGHAEAGFEKYGEFEPVEMHIAFDLPSAVVLNGEPRLARIRFRQDENTHARIRLNCIQGSHRVSFASLPEYWEADNFRELDFYIDGVMQSDSVDDVTFLLECESENGKQYYSCEKKMTVVKCYTEPLKSTEIDPPAVGPNFVGTYELIVEPDGGKSSEVQWRVVGNGVSFVNGDMGKRVQLRGNDTGGAAVLEARAFETSDSYWKFYIKAMP